MANETRAWEEQKRQWRSEITLLQKEKSTLLHAIEGAGQAEAAVEADRVDALRDQERLTFILDALPPLLNRAEAALRAWPDRLPPSLLEPLEPAFRPLMQARADDKKISDGPACNALLPCIPKSKNSSTPSTW